MKDKPWTMTTSTINPCIADNIVNHSPCVCRVLLWCQPWPTQSRIILPVCAECYSGVNPGRPSQESFSLCVQSATLVSTLADPVKIRSWQIAGLPKDTLSVENGVVAQ